MSSPVSVNDLARRICVANHRADLSPTREMPCSVHIREAKLYIGLTQPQLAKTLQVLVESTDA